MKILFYVFATVAALFGVLGLLRTIDVAISGGGIQPMQLLIAIVFLFLAGLWVKRARLK